jgi:protein-disulfide isomerase
VSTREERRKQARAEREAREQAALRAAHRRRRLQQLGAVVGVAAIVVAGLVLLGQKSREPSTAGSGGAVVGAADMRAMLAGIPQKGTSLGDPQAPLVLTEFADLQCPYCRVYTLKVLPQIIDRYVRTKKLRLELRLRRLLGPDSGVAARAAQAAARRNRMWNFVDVFYRNQGDENTGYVTDAFLSRMATAAGLPAKLVLDGSRSPALEKPVQEAEAESSAAGLEGTPAFVIGPDAGTGKVLNVPRLDIGSFVAAIDPQLPR